MSKLQRLVERFASGRVWAHRIRRWRERRAGVDFSSVVPPAEIGLDPRRAVMVSPSGNKWLRRVLDELDISAADVILDVGCGKGSAMKLMLEFPFSRVDGIELSAQIATIARANFCKLEVSPQRYGVMTGDASEFKALDQYNYIYFYHPFSCDIMVSFMTHLTESLQRRPRRLTIVYDNPVCHDAVVAGAAFFKNERDYPDEWGNRIYVYRNEAALVRPGGYAAASRVKRN